MKILYFAEWDCKVESGVSIKIKAQVKEWRKQGATVHLIVLSPSLQESGGISVFNEIGAETVQHSFSPGTILGKVSKAYQISEIANLVKMFSPEIIYYRQTSWNVGMSKIFLGRHKTVLEVNSNDLYEVGRAGKILRALYHRFSRSNTINVSHAFACVSHELENEFKQHNKPTITIGNGYELSIDRFVEKCKSGRPSCIFVGSDGQPWHGLDRIYMLASELAEITFHIVGPRKLGPDVVPNNVVQHGYMSPEQLIKIYRQVDFGVSSMALHRAGITEASPLKSREYLAHLLPVIGSYTDTDLSGSDMYLQIGDINFDVKSAADRIRRFASAWRHKKIDINAVFKLIGHQVKEQRRLKFFEDLLVQRS